MKIREIGEHKFIGALKKGFKTPHTRVVKGIGDDTSVTIQTDTRLLLTTTDTLNEGVHFSLEYTDAKRLGRKALNVSISDIAAMGGVPTFYLVALSVPPSTDAEFLHELYLGLKEAGLKAGCTLIGGNTSSSKKISITTTVLGEISKDEVVYRSGAAIGDTVYASGTLGGASLGLSILSVGGKRRHYEEAIERHLDPTPRLKLGRYIAKDRLASAMIDLSDGLVADLRHICDESKVGAEIELMSVPVSRELYEWEPDLKERALTGGEDYELLFTAPASSLSGLTGLSEKLGIDITPIGKIVEKEKGITVLDKTGQAMDIEIEGFDHFAKKEESPY